MRRPFQESRHSRGDKLQRPVPAVNAQAFSKFKAASEKQNEVGNTQGRDAFSTCAARIPIPPNARSLQSKNRVRPRTRFFNLCWQQAWNAFAPMERSAAWFVLLSMSERATTRLIGLSVSGFFLMMLMLNAISS